MLDTVDPKGQTPRIRFLAVSAQCRMSPLFYKVVA